MAGKARKVGLTAVGLLLLAAAATAGYKFYLLGGQKANWARMVRTETGSTPHYKPIQYRARDARPAIMAPEFLPAERATLAGGSMGIGVVVGDDARFYPLHILAYHQIVNDQVGGKCVACTY